MAKYGVVQHQGPSAVRSSMAEGGLGQPESRSLKSIETTLRWASETLAAARSAHATDEVLERMAAFIAPEVAAASAALDDRHGNAGPDGDGDPAAAVESGLDRADSAGVHRADLFEQISPGTGGKTELGPAVDELVRDRHDASPSAGESAERGDASTLSVGGDPAAGAGNNEAPAAPTRQADPVRGFDLWAEHISEQASAVSSAAESLRSTPPSHGRELCAFALKIELVKLRGLTAEAPLGVSLTSAFRARSEAAAALAEATTQP